MNRTLLAMVAAVVGACASLSPTGERPVVTASDLDGITAVLKRDFHARGIAKMDRVEQDALQRACELNADQPPADMAKRIETEQLNAIPIPQGSLLGDWQRGQKIAQNGSGMQWNNKPGQASGGSCYNCHQLSPQEDSYGTIGPSLRSFGKLRGNGAEIQRYVYGKIYNAKAYSACSVMPRLGQSGTLTDQQIRDLTAYLLDPASPVNR